MTRNRSTHLFGVRAPALKVMLRLVNGDSIQIERGVHFIRQVQDLSDQGATGRDIVRLLLGEDWNTPPLGMTVTGPAVDGRPIDLTIACW